MKDAIQAAIRTAGYSIHRRGTIEELIQRNKVLNDQDSSAVVDVHSLGTLQEEVRKLRQKNAELEQTGTQLAARNASIVEQLAELRAKNAQLLTALSEANQPKEGPNQWVGEYLDLTQSVFGRSITPITDTSIKAVSSFPIDSKYFQSCTPSLFGAEVTYAGDLLQDIRDHDVPGDVVEFGVFKGEWVNRLYDLMQAARLERRLWGFDSFQGLSKPSGEFDDPYWKEGMFNAGLEEVRRLVKADQRTSIKLVPGFFSESLKSQEAKDLRQVSFVRIDCDIYEPAVECLDFLGDRLSHGSILVFDDWSHNPHLGETKAFFDWVKTVPHLAFEFIFFGMWDHFYIRVWHRDKPRW